MRIGSILALGSLLMLGGAQPPLQHPIRAIELEGVTLASSQEVSQPLAALVGTQPDLATLQSALLAIEKWYHERGYTLAKVTAYEQKEDGTLKVQVAEGRVAAVEITGTKRTRPEVLLREIKLKPGSLYHEPRTEAIRRRLGRLPYLRQVQVAPIPAETVGQARLQVKVEEESSLLLALAVGYSQEGGLLGYVDVADANFLGYGHQVRLQWQREQLRDPMTGEVEPRRASYALLYEAPYLIAGTLDVGLEAYDRSSPFYPLFTLAEAHLRHFEHRQGILGWLGYHWSESLTLRLQFRHDRVDYNDAPANLLDPLSKIQNQGRVVTLGFQNLWDNRERLNFPRSGSYFSLLVESSLNPSDFSFTRYVSEVRYYLPLRGERSLGFRLLGGWAGGTLPLSEQFWIGGYELLRGYDLEEFHGDRLLLFSAEYRFPILPDIQGVLFLDHGLAWQNRQKRGLGDFKTGVGVGVRFATPIGPIRLDFAVGKKGFTYLSLGQAF